MSGFTAPNHPLDAAYTKYWCEENVYRLTAHFLSIKKIANYWQVFVVFISNASKTVRQTTSQARRCNLTHLWQVALWHQSAACDPEQAIVWDYHVILILKARKAPQTTTAQSGQADERGPVTVVYDFDTLLPKPCDFISLVLRLPICKRLRSNIVADYMVETFAPRVNLGTKYERYVHM